MEQLDRSNRRRLLSGFVIVGFAIVAAVVLTGPVGSPDESPLAAAPSPTSTPDEHVVWTPGGDIAFRAVDDMLVVTRTFAGQEIELAAASLAYTGVGSTVFELMVCPSPQGGPMERYIFGRIETNGQTIVYSGPPAFGQGASDGLFLFALHQGELDWEDTISIASAARNEVRTDGAQFTNVASLGRRLPSGCSH